MSKKQRKIDMLSDLPGILAGQFTEKMIIIQDEPATRKDRSEYIENLKRDSSKLRERFVEGKVKIPARLPYTKRQLPEDHTDYENDRMSFDK